MTRSFRLRPSAGVARCLGALAAAAVLAAAVPVQAQGPATADTAQALLQRAELASRSDPESARRLAEQVLADNPTPDHDVRARLLLCDYFVERDRSAVAPHLARMQAQVPALHQRGLRAGVLACEGQLLEAGGDNASALLLYDQAVQAAEVARDDEWLANVLYLRGYLLGVQGEYARGLADLRRALGHYTALNLPLQAHATVTSVGMLYSRLGEYEQARRTFEEALARLPERPPSRERAIVMHHLGNALTALGRWHEARPLFEQVLAGSRELGYPLGQAQALLGLATVDNALGDATRALAQADDAARLDGLTPDERLRANLLLQRGAALRRLKRNADAVTALRTSAEVFQRAGAAAEEGRAHDELAQALADNGDWRGAFEQQTAARRLAEQLLVRQRDQRFASLKVQFDTEAQVQANAALMREKRATELALAEQQRVSTLQVVAAVLASALALSLGALAWRQRATGRRMRDLAMTDELTGLPNRRQTMRELGELLQQTPPRGVLLILDLDRFKPINDQFGHVIGDEILKAFTAACRPVVQSHRARMGRLGGEEFLVMLVGAPLPDGEALAEALRRAVASLDVSRWLPDRGITISIGLTALQVGDTASVAMARADRALYRAKANGRDRIESEWAPLSGFTPDEVSAAGVTSAT